jgi:hypothetical protein
MLASELNLIDPLLSHGAASWIDDSLSFWLQPKNGNTGEWANLSPKNPDAITPIYGSNTARRYEAVYDLENGYGGMRCYQGGGGLSPTFLDFRYGLSTGSNANNIDFGSEHTLLAFCLPVGTVGSSTDSCIIGGIPTVGISIGLGWNLSTQAYYYDGNNSLTNIQQVSHKYRKPLLYGVTRNGSSLKYYYDGDCVSTPTKAGGSTDPLYVRFVGNLNSRSFDGNVYLAAGWRRELIENEMKDIARNWYAGRARFVARYGLTQPTPWHLFGGAA